jgi:signal transduction histidine kinase
MRLTTKFFLWNAASVFVSFGVSALTVAIFTAQFAKSRGLLERAKFDDPSHLSRVVMEAASELYTGLAVAAIGSFMICFLILNWWVSHRFSQGIIKPMLRLKEAAAKISEGDLSGGIAEEGEGEVKALCRSLELMRLKLKESIRMQERYDENRKFLLSSISHDLKSPVTAIIGYLEGIRDGVAATPEKMAHYLETARTKAIQVNNMIDDLLLYSRLDMEQLPYHFEETELAGYAAACVEDHRDAFERARVELGFVNELSGAVTVRIDRERFRRVIQNVLDNARKHAARQNGRVELVVRETRTSAIIEVRDNGEGIPEEHLSRLFERFYRADPSRSNADGSGLGLAIAKQIVEGHEGRIWVTSKLGEGTRVMISLMKR